MPVQKVPLSSLPVGYNFMLGGVYFRVVAQILDYTEVLKLRSTLENVGASRKRIFLPNNIEL